MTRWEDDIRARGLEIFRLMDAGPPALFNRKSWTGMLMNLAMRDPDLKVRLFRFVDVLPALTTPELMVNHLKEYFLGENSHVPPLLARLLSGIKGGISSRIAAELVRKNILSFSHTFIAGASPAEALPALRKLWQTGSAVTVDILGEAALSEREAEIYLGLYLELITTLAQEMAARPLHDPERELLPPLNVSVKISSLYSRIGPVNHEDSVRHVKERLRPIFRRAREVGGFVNLDLEMYSLKNITLDVFTELLDEEEFRGWTGAGLALQAYLTDAWEDLQRLTSWAEKEGRRITIRLVKGAYWEYETVIARQKGWPAPVFTRKSHTDWNFERCAEYMLAHSDIVTPALATHNVRSLAAAMVAAERHGADGNAFEFQMLYGMAEPVKSAVRRMGYVIREYTPVGALIPGMAYLVRRLLENTSNEGFLRKAFAADVSPEALLAAPEPWPGEPPPLPRQGRGAFVNEAFTDFSVKERRTEFRAAIEKVRGELGRAYPAVIGGRNYRGGEIISVNPANPAEVVGRVAAVSREAVQEALAAARRAQPGWAALGAEIRAEVLFKAADRGRARRMELAAWQILETGKQWAEADADVAEAIDYLEYYGREMLRIAPPLKTQDIPGEDNRYFYQARGVALVTAPWNFPLAISAGMVSAALVAGNSVLYKPSSLSPVNGWQLFSLLREAGLPEGVLSFIPGPGGAIGDWLAGDPGLDLIAFTGSREVGMGLLEGAARQVPGQRSVKRVIAEMGGKNAIIIDADADLDQAVASVLQSAFGYQGQKCSACSRVIVMAGCYDRFLERLSEAVRGIMVGPPEDPASFMGPLISEEAKERVERYLALAAREGTIVAQGEAPKGSSYVPPTVVTDLSPASTILREEIFGPLLAVLRVATIDEALAVANETEFALTGGLFSRSPATISRVVREFVTGNLYINRTITGAIVGRQPFGGLRLSGVGSKAGGPDYLLQFLEPRVVTENTMRRGFSPEVLS